MCYGFFVFVFFFFFFSSSFSVSVKVGYIKAAITFTPVSFTFSTTFMLWLCLDARSALNRTSSVTRNCNILCHNCNVLCHNCKIQYPLKYDTERRAPSIDFCNAQTHTRARANKHTHEQRYAKHIVDDKRDTSKHANIHDVLSL